MHGYRFMIPFVAAQLFTACTLDSATDLAPLTPRVVGDHIVIADVNAESLAVMAPKDGHTGSLRRIPLSGAPSNVTPLPGRDATLVLSRLARTLDVVDVTVGASPAVRSFDVGAPFEAVAVSDDAHYAVAYFPPNTASTVFHNENEVALIDLSPTLAASDAVSRRTLPSLGGAPLVVTFSPVVNGRRYLFALSAEHVAIAAADQPDRKERSVPLVSLTTGGTRTPRSVTFGVQTDSAGLSTLWAIVTTAEANSVYALAITPRVDPLDGEADFDVNLSQLAGIGPGGDATLITLPPAADGEEARLATLTTNPGAGTVTLTDVLTATGRTLPLSAGLNRIVLFRGERGTDEALVYNANSVSSTFHILDINAFDTGEQRAYRTRTTREPFTSVIPIPGTPRFIVLKTGSNNSVGILDADTDRVAGFGKTGDIKSLELNTDLDRLYALTRVDNQDYVVSVNLMDLHPESSPVPEGGDLMMLLPNVATVATWRNSPGGHLVLWPALSTLPEDALVAPGFLLDGLLR